MRARDQEAVSGEEGTVVQESQTIGPFEDHGRGQGTGGDVAENASFGHPLYGAPGVDGGGGARQSTCGHACYYEAEKLFLEEMKPWVRLVGRRRFSSFSS